MVTLLKQKKIPTLRFPGSSDGWEEKKLGDVARIYDGTHQTPNYVKEGISFYSVEQVTANDFLNTKFVTNDVFEAENKRIKIEKNDILMTRIGDIGTARLIDWNARASFYVSLALIKCSEKIKPNFLSQYINSSNFQKQLWKKTIHAAFPKKINLGEIGECKLFAPAIPEQQKIAEFLGVVDTWIENLRAQKENFESYKKGMMQKIFSQEIRFKDANGKNFSGWEEKKLGDVGNITTGTTPSTANKEYYGNDFPWITPTDINEEKNIYTSARFLTKKGIEKGRFVPKDTLLVTCIASIGKNAILRVDGSCNQQINAVSPNKENDVDFLYYLIEKNKNILIRFAGAGGMQMLNKKDFSNLKFRIPPLLEQQKIAEFLTSIDKIIESKQQQITQAEQWKKGLMQGLFV